MQFDNGSAPFQFFYVVLLFLFEDEQPPSFLHEQPSALLFPLASFADTQKQALVLLLLSQGRLN